MDGGKMFFRAFAGLLIAALLMIAPGKTLAQAAPGPTSHSAPAPPPSPRALALAHQYMQVMHVEEMNKKMMASIFGGMRGNNAGVSDAEANKAADAIQAMIAPMVEKLVGQMEPIVAETFTERELQAMVDFYGSPVGQSVLQKIPLMTSKMSAISRDMMQETIAKTAAPCSGANCPPKP
jgi:hypothetical protein